MLSKKNDQIIGNMQILRVFAASGVVVYHAAFVIAGVHTEFYGVALFFLISGYLMCKISKRSALDFARDRFWRIVPNYWFAMALLLALFNLWQYWPSKHIFLSALFIPHDSPVGFYPVLGVGWTLNMEIYFYAVFALSIFINRRRSPIIAGVIILTIWFGLPYVTANKAFIFYYTHSYILYFVLGIVVWYLDNWIKSKTVDLSLPRWIMPVSIVVYATAVIFHIADPIWLVLVLSLIAIIGANFGADLKPRLLMFMGNASYACYLLHTTLIEFLRVKGIAVSGTIQYTLVILIGSWAIAILWYISIEKLISKLRHWMTQHRYKEHLPDSNPVTYSTQFSSDPQQNVSEP